jgi:hypothetical protein
MHIDYAHGQVAQTIHNYGDVYLDGSPAESSKKNRFLALAKEKMPDSCHHQLEWIVNHSDVHGECLLLACDAKALVCKDGRLAQALALPAYAFGGLCIAILFAFSALCTWIWMSLHQNLSMASEGILFAFISAGALTIYWLQRRYFYSHLVAQRVVTALARPRRGARRGKRA